MIRFLTNDTSINNYIINKRSKIKGKKLIFLIFLFYFFFSFSLLFMLLYDILIMEDIVESSPRTTATTTRRLRSLHLPSSGSNSTNEISRRFNSLRRPNTSNTSPLGLQSITPPTNDIVTEPIVTEPQIQKVHIKLVPNVGMTNRCFVFDVVDRELEMGGSGLKLGRYSDRTIVSDRLSFKSKVVSRYHAEIWLSEEDGKVF